MSGRVFEVTLEIRDGNWLSSNGSRLHWTRVRERVQALRWLGHAAARNADIPHLGRCHVAAYVTPRTFGRFDPNNAAPTTKALIDGMTDYGVWPDDNDLWVQGPDHRRGEGVAPPGVRLVRMVITELEPRGES